MSWWGCIVCCDVLICDEEGFLWSLELMSSELKDLKRDTEVEIDERNWKELKIPTDRLNRWLKSVSEVEEKLRVLILLESEEEEVAADHHRRHGRYKIGAVRLAKRVDQLIIKRKNFKVDEMFVHKFTVGERGHPVVGLEHKLDEILKYLADKRVRIVGIHGCGGSGKSTLLCELKRELGKMPGHGGLDRILHFDDSMNNFQGKTDDVSSFQFEIGRRLGLTWGPKEEESQHLRSVKLKKALKKKRYLILVDDIREQQLDLTAVGVPRHTKVVFTATTTTTTNKAAMAAALQVGRKDIFMDPLGEEDSWILFKISIEACNVCKLDPRIVPLARDVSKLCGGLPLAIVSIGTRMCNIREIRRWEGIKGLLASKAGFNFLSLRKDVHEKIMMFLKK